MHAPHGLVVFKKITNKNFKFFKIKLLDLSWTAPQGRILVSMNSKLSIGYLFRNALNKLNLTTCLEFMEQPQNIYEIHFSWSGKNMTDTLEQVQSLLLPHVKSAGAKSSRYSASKMWNRLPVHLRIQENFLTFKHAVRKHMWTEVQRHEDGVYLLLAFHFIYIQYFKWF